MEQTTLFAYSLVTILLWIGKKIKNTVEIVYNDIGYNDEPDITTELW